METRLSLEDARKTIAQLVSCTVSETVPLMDALGRIPSKTYYAPYPLPDYNQSLFDGYAIPAPVGDINPATTQYALAGEVAAGDTSVKRILPGTAYRIMTGAMTPHGTWKVIPQENCEEVSGRVFVKASVADRYENTIRGRGTKVRKGAVLVSRGQVLSAQYLAKLSQFGMENIEVFSRVRVAYFCTGSELVDMSDHKQRGQKFSSNRYLLSALIRQSDSEVYDGGIVRDNKSDLESLFTRLEAEGPTIIISTGGMGPGKYDLLEESFDRIGGKTIFSSLGMRPGKSILFGLLGRSLFFGLPGPPFAVQTLYYALVLPTILAAQGHACWRPAMKRARLDEDIHLNGKDMLRLQEGILFVRNEVNMVRTVRRNELPNCYIYCSAGRKNFRRGTLISVQTIS